MNHRGVKSHFCAHAALAQLRTPRWRNSLVNMMDFSHVHATAADMDDPDLLAELAAITGEQQPPTTARVAEPATKARVASLKKEALALKKANNIGAAKAKLAEAKRLEAQMAQLAATPPPAPRAAPGLGGIPSEAATAEVEGVTLSAADMNDPDLLAELAAITGDLEPRAPAPPAASLERQAAQAKAAADDAKRSGNKAEAMRQLKRAKELEAQAARLAAAAPPDSELAALMASMDGGGGGGSGGGGAHGRGGGGGGDAGGAEDDEMAQLVKSMPVGGGAK